MLGWKEDEKDKPYKLAILEITEQMLRVMGKKTPVKSFYILQVKKLKQLMSKERTEVHIINGISPHTYPPQQIYSKYFSLMHT